LTQYPELALGENLVNAGGREKGTKAAIFAGLREFAGGVRTVESRRLCLISTELDL